MSGVVYKGLVRSISEGFYESEEGPGGKIK